MKEVLGCMLFVSLSSQFLRTCRAKAKRALMREERFSSSLNRTTMGSENANGKIGTFYKTGRLGDRTRLDI